MKKTSKKKQKDRLEKIKNEKLLLTSTEQLKEMKKAKLRRI